MLTEFRQINNIEGRSSVAYKQIKIPSNSSVRTVGEYSLDRNQQDRVQSIVRQRFSPQSNLAIFIQAWLECSVNNLSWSLITLKSDPLRDASHFVCVCGLFLSIPIEMCFFVL